MQNYKLLICKKVRTYEIQQAEVYNSLGTGSLSHLTLQTDIWLVVSVPVLSEQITEVQPSVSTDGKLRTMAFFRAILLVPSARQVVMTAGRPGRERNKQRKELCPPSYPSETFTVSCLRPLS